jgi:ABC-type methionine transport system ATPase subunit
MLIIQNYNILVNAPVFNNMFYRLEFESCKVYERR